jgi:hypothetical protein
MSDDRQAQVPSRPAPGARAAQLRGPGPHPPQVLQVLKQFDRCCSTWTTTAPTRGAGQRQAHLQPSSAARAPAPRRRRETGLPRPAGQRRRRTGAARARLQQDHGWLEEDWLSWRRRSRPSPRATAGTTPAPAPRAAGLHALYHEHIALEESLIYPEAKRRQAALATAAQRARRGILKTGNAFWMPFTANRQFKKAPRMFVGAKDMHYTTSTAARCSTAPRACGACNAGHCRPKIVEAIQSRPPRWTTRRPSRWATPRPSSWPTGGRDRARRAWTSVLHQFGLRIGRDRAEDGARLPPRAGRGTAPA